MIQMPIMSGTIHSMMKAQQLQMKWQQRKENPNMPKNDDPRSMQIAELQRDAERVRKGNIIASIDGKLKAGYKLSTEELDYIRENSPELYKKAIEVAMEREQYRKELEKCKTKEDVERLNSNKMQSMLSQVKTINSNPNISQGKKLELMEQITRRVMGIKSEHVTFTSSPQYASLPREIDLEEEKAKKKEKPVVTIEQDDTPERPQYDNEPEQVEDPDIFTKPTEETQQTDTEQNDTENKLSKPSGAQKVVHSAATSSQKPAHSASTSSQKPTVPASTDVKQGSVTAKGTTTVKSVGPKSISIHA